MNKEQEKVLKQMIKENNTQDHTSTIMELKHSALIRRDVSVIQNIKRKHHSKDFSILDKEARSQNCGFLFQHYPNIYNKYHSILEIIRFFSWEYQSMRRQEKKGLEMKQFH